MGYVSFREGKSLTLCLNCIWLPQLQSTFRSFVGRGFFRSSIKRDEPGCLILTPQIWITLSHKKRVPMHQPVFHGMRVSITAHIFGFEAWWTTFVSITCCRFNKKDAWWRRSLSATWRFHSTSCTVAFWPFGVRPHETWMWFFSCVMCVCSWYVWKQGLITCEGGLSHHLEKYNLHDCILWDWQTDENIDIQSWKQHIRTYTPQTNMKKTLGCFQDLLYVPFGKFWNILSIRGSKWWFFQVYVFFAGHVFFFNGGHYINMFVYIHI